MLWIDRDAGGVVAGEGRVGVDPLPGAAAVVGAVEPHSRADGVDGGVDARAPAAGRHGEADATHRLGGEAVAGEVRPGPAAVRRLVDAAPRADVGGEVGEPGVVADLPGRGVDGVGRGRIGGEVGGAAVGVHEQDVLPAPAAVRAAEDAALRVGAEEVPLGGGEHHVGVAGIDPQAADVAAGGEPARLPGPAAVARAIDAVASGDVPAGGDLAGAHVEDGGIAGSHRQGADGGGRLVLEQRIPGAPGVGGLPDAAVGRAEVEGVRLPRDSSGAGAPPAAQRADETPAQAGVVLRRHGHGRGGGDQGKEDGEARNEAAEIHGTPPETRLTALECIAGRSPFSPCARRRSPPARCAGGGGRAASRSGPRSRPGSSRPARPSASALPDRRG